MKEERILKIKPPLPKDGEFVKHEYINVEGLPFKPKYDVEGYQGLHWYLIKETERGKLFFRTLEEAGRDAAFRLYIERMKSRHDQYSIIVQPHFYEESEKEVIRKQIHRDFEDLIVNKFYYKNREEMKDLPMYEIKEILTNEDLIKNVSDIPKTRSGFDEGESILRQMEKLAKLIDVYEKME